MYEVGDYAQYLVAVNCCPSKESRELLTLGRRIVYLSFKHDPDNPDEDRCEDLEDVDSYQKVVQAISNIYVDR